MGWGRFTFAASSIASAVCAGLVIVASMSAGATTDAARSDPGLDRALGEAFRASHAQSVSAAVVFGNGRTWRGAAGIADTATHGRATPSTPYAVASVTKMFVATVAMQLVVEGVLTLDEPVARWLPQLRGAERITLRQLLGHTSGLAETPPDDNIAHRWTPDEALARMPDPACEPGSCFGYVDVNYVAVGQVIAAATGQPIEDVLRARILRPLHLDDTWLQGFERARDKVAPAGLDGFAFDDPEGNTPSTDFVTRIGAAGALATTPTDLAKFGHALFQDDLVRADALATMTDIEPSAPLPCPDINRCPPAYGLGVGTEILNGFKTLGHSGSTGALVAFFPKPRLTIAVVTNFGGDPYLAARALAEAIPATRQRLDLFTIGAHGDGVHPIAHRDGQRSGSAVSPDGNLIAYRRKPGQHAQIVVSRVDGSHPRVVVDDLAWAGSPTWSPDGARLAFSAQPGEHADIYRVDADGTHRRQLTHGTEWSDGPSWSPDGTLIAYHANAYDDPEMEIRVIHPDGTGMRTVVRMPIRGRYMGYPRWSPDGTRLAFTGADGGDTDIQTVALDGSNLATLTTDHVPEAEPAWASDGRIAFARLGDIFVINPGDPEIQRITNTPSEEYGLDWFPDASRLIYTDRR